LLALRAAEVVSSKPRKSIGPAISRLGARLAPFPLSEYRSDPVLAMAVHRILLERGIDHASLAALVAAYAKVLADDNHAPRPELALVVYLVRSCGFEITEPLSFRNGSLSAAAELVITDRKQILEICRLVATITACGIRPIGLGELRLLLPSLCVSYAMDWDIEAVNTLLRTCAYVGAGKESACQWALDWLLDQQQSDGRFGLLAPEERKMGCETADWRLYFYPTVGTLWSLAEIHQPGFLVL
jgi:hypothetical protein